MPALVRVYIQSVFVGFLIATAFTAGLIWLDVAGIGHLIQGSDIGWIAAAMLIIFNGIVFSAVQFAFRIMAVTTEDEGPKGGHGAGELVPVPLQVKAKARARH
jgi:TRAP-type C4-dicarboxylate transport system permease small subunit